MISCKYKTDAKRFCKGEQSECSDLISTNETDKWVNSGRFSLYDNTNLSVLKVTIKDLTEDDSGKYNCGVDKSGKIDSYTEVNLKISTGEKLRSSNS